MALRPRWLLGRFASLIPVRLRLPPRSQGHGRPCLPRSHLGRSRELWLSCVENVLMLTRRSFFKVTCVENVLLCTGRDARRRRWGQKRAGVKNYKAMRQEIERKFLVRGEFKSSARKAMRISQGYLSSVPERTVRVRVRDNQGFITVKGKSDIRGVSRFEWEKEISVDDALALLGLCEPGVIDKTRYLVDYAGHTFEVDEFYGDNEGLVMAEIELSCEDEAFEKPDWLGDEVTGDSRYYNAALTKNPYINWEK